MPTTARTRPARIPTARFPTSATSRSDQPITGTHRFEVETLAPTLAGGATLMRIDLFDASRRLGSMMLSIGASDGVIQITDIRVEPDVRRIGHGSAMFHEGLRRARELLATSARAGSDSSSGESSGASPGESSASSASSASSSVPLRRVIIMLGQKSQLLARGFVLRHGFHHIKTIPDLGHGEDVMVYVKGLN